MKLVEYTLYTFAYFVFIYLTESNFFVLFTVLLWLLKTFHLLMYFIQRYFYYI